MSYADEVFIANCKNILENGTWDTDYNVRPHWDDGTSAHTIKKFGIVNRYDLSKEFPAMTLRKTFIKSATDELLWIWQKKSNNVNDFNGHVWDSWADESGRTRCFPEGRRTFLQYNPVKKKGKKLRRRPKESQ